MPGYEASNWSGIGAPKHTPPEIVDKLNKEINVVLTKPKFTARLAELGAAGLPGSPADFAKLIANETEKMGQGDPGGEDQAGLTRQFADELPSSLRSPASGQHVLKLNSKGGKAMKIQQAISSTILIVLLTAQMAWAQDNIRAAMEAANNEWSAAYNSLNGKAFPALYTKDAVLMPPGVQPINGSEAIGQFWADLIKAGNRKNFTIEIASIQSDGKYAYQTGRWTLDLVKDNGEVTKVVGSTVRIFEEQPDGKWLAKVHIYNVY